MTGAAGPAPCRAPLAALVVAWSGLPARAASQPPEPIIVDIVEQESEISGLADILIGALGLTGLMMLGAILAAVVFAGALFWFRSRADREDHSDTPVTR